VPTLAPLFHTSRCATMIMPAGAAWPQCRRSSPFWHISLGPEAGKRWRSDRPIEGWSERASTSYKPAKRRRKRTRISRRKRTRRRRKRTGRRRKIRPHSAELSRPRREEREKKYMREILSLYYTHHYMALTYEEMALLASVGRGGSVEDTNTSFSPL
jgi:hypothetical protein